MVSVMCPWSRVKLLWLFWLAVQFGPPCIPTPREFILAHIKLVLPGMHVFFATSRQLSFPGMPGRCPAFHHHLVSSQKIFVAMYFLRCLRPTVHRYLLPSSLLVLLSLDLVVHCILSSWDVELMSSLSSSSCAISTGKVICNESAAYRIPVCVIWRVF